MKNFERVFWDAISNNNKLYLIPCEYPHIICINMDTDDLEYIRLENKLLQENKEKSRYACGSIFYSGEVIYMTMLDLDYILSIDLKSKKINSYRCKLLEGRGAGICGDEENIWVIPIRQKKLYIGIEQRKSGYNR